jgi:hypothetical protein
LQLFSCRMGPQIPCEQGKIQGSFARLRSKSSDSAQNPQILLQTRDLAGISGYYSQVI